MNPAEPKFPMLVLERAAELWSASLKDLRNHCRVQSVADARFAVTHVLHVAGWRDTDIGRFFKMEPCSIKFARKRAEELRRTDKLFAGRLDLLLETLDDVKLLPEA